MNAVREILVVDVSKSKLDIVLLISGKFRAKVFPNTREGHQALLEWISKSKANLSALHVYMEATAVYHEAVAATLHALGFKVSVINPACIKRFGHSENICNKNDEIDASLIARCLAMVPELCAPPPLEHRQLPAWTLRVQALRH